MQAEAQNIIIKKLQELQQRIIANIESSGQSASGRTAASLRVEPNETGATLYGRRAFATLETGRKPGKTPYQFTRVIWQWIVDKGIRVSPIDYKRQASAKWQPMYSPQERGELSLAGAIAHKIQTEGTALFRNGGRSDVYSNEIPRTIAEIKQEITPLLKAEILQTIKINN